jgi:hypothetical protein
MRLGHLEASSGIRLYRSNDFVQKVPGPASHTHTTTRQVPKLRRRLGGIKRWRYGAAPANGGNMGAGASGATIPLPRPGQAPSLPLAFQNA